MMNKKSMMEIEKEYEKETQRVIKEMIEYDNKRIEINDNALLEYKDKFLWDYEAIKEYLSELDSWDFKGVVKCVKDSVGKTSKRDIYIQIDDEGNYKYQKQSEEEFMIDDEKENPKNYYILIWQNGGGYVGDDYFGYIFFPLKEKDMYFKIDYTC